MTTPAKATLVTDPNARATFTADADMDTRTAIMRGLADYIGLVKVDAIGGRQIVIKKTYDVWATPEQDAVYPSAIVSTPGVATYDASRFTPGVNPSERLPPPDGRYLVQYAELTVDVSVELWCTDPIERRLLVAALERFMNPVTWMYGFKLDLPYYYGTRAVYELKSMQYLDSEEDAMRRYRRAVLVVGGQASLVQLVAFPDAKVLARVDAVGPDADVIVRGQV